MKAIASGVIMWQIFDKCPILVKTWDILGHLGHWHGGWDMHACKPLPGSSVVYYGCHGYVTAPLRFGLKHKYAREPM
jgi:hypothetical protein